MSVPHCICDHCLLKYAASDMLAALRNVNKLISEAAMTGFNCHDGDWPERLFHSQQATSAAIKKATTPPPAQSGGLQVKRWLETKGQSLCTWLAVMRVDHGQPWGWLESIWIGIWWRYYCPRPPIDDWTARACVNSGNCGCNNGTDGLCVPATQPGGSK